jgi:hypothetical protein
MTASRLIYVDIGAGRLQLILVITFYTGMFYINIIILASDE